jgi:dsRNA-specific ribonuclease
VARAEGGTKKKAEQLAAKQALEHLRGQAENE